MFEAGIGLAAQAFQGPDSASHPQWHSMASAVGLRAGHAALTAVAAGMAAWRWMAVLAWSLACSHFPGGLGLGLPQVLGDRPRRGLEAELEEWLLAVRSVRNLGLPPSALMA